LPDNFNPDINTVRKGKAAHPHYIYAKDDPRVPSVSVALDFRKDFNDSRLVFFAAPPIGPSHLCNFSDGARLALEMSGKILRDFDSALADNFKPDK
jgi:hypothetical protein